MNAKWKNRALIDLTALRENTEVVRRLAPKSKLMAVVKANAYGHDLNTVARELSSLVDGFAVATIEEGGSLREIVRDKPVAVLSGFCAPEHLKICSSQQFEPVIHSRHQIGWFDHHSGPPLDVWLKFNSGMNRLGLVHEEFLEAYAMLDRHPKVAKIRLMSHFAVAEDATSDFTNEQLRRFAHAATGLANERSIANSAGIMCWPDTHLDWVRPGLMLYGISPLTDQAKNYGLRPVMELQAKVISIQHVKEGQSIGYGRTFVANRPMKIANLGIGYGDGYFRTVSDAAHVMIHNQKAPIAGTISMDSMAVDISNIQQAQIGDVATLWGNLPSVVQVSEWAGTNAYEILCRLSARVPREISNSH